MANQSTDVWAIGEVYQSYVGRWSRLAARDFVAWLGVPGDRRWLDIGCGTGALSATILQHAAPHCASRSAMTCRSGQMAAFP